MYLLSLGICTGYRIHVTVRPCTIPRVKSLCMRFCELCKRQNAKLIPKEFTFLDAFCVHCGYMVTTRDSEAEG